MSICLFVLLLLRLIPLVKFSPASAMVYTWKSGW